MTRLAEYRTGRGGSRIGRLGVHGRLWQFSQPVRVAQLKISRLDQRRMRLSRISKVGLGMSGYRLRYVVTLFRWASPSSRATSLASIRSSTSISSPRANMSDTDLGAENVAP